MDKAEMLTVEETGGKLSNEMLYKLSFVLFALSRILFGSSHLGDMMGEGVVTKISDALLVCALMVLVLLAANFHYPKTDLVPLLACGGIIGLSLLKCRSTNLFISFLYMYFAVVVAHPKRFARLVIGLFAAIIVILALLSVSGLISMTVKQRASNDATRYSLGFTHANQLAIMVFVIICMLFYIHSGSGRWGKYWKYIVSGALAIPTFLVTNTFSFLALYLLLAFASFAYDAALSKAHLPKREAKRFIRIGLLILGVITGLAVLYIWRNPYALSGGLKTFRTRFLLSQKYITAYGIKPFGSKIAIGTDVAIPGFKAGYYYLDNGYIRLFVEYGFVAGLLVVGLMARTLINLVRRSKWQLLIILLCILLYLFNEQKMMTVFFNPFWLLLREYMLPDRAARLKALLAG